MGALFSKKNKEVFSTPLGLNNPVTVQVLGICSALAVTAKLEPAIVMGLSVTVITAFSNVVISLLRKTIPNRIRIIVQLVVVAALVTIVSEILKAFGRLSDGYPWIVQNTSNNGATVLLNTEVFKELSDQVEGNLIIIPSSTHEVLAMDARLVPDCDDLSAFIQQTNMDVVSPSERLSNQVYMYDRKENSIEMVTRNKLDIIPQESRNISYEKNIKPEI